jgi:hypothetical protein
MNIQTNDAQPNDGETNDGQPNFRQPIPILRVPVEVYLSRSYDHQGSFMLMNNGYRIHVEYVNSAFDEEIYIDGGLVCSRDWAD